jgi:hypothetical protein
VRVGQHSQQTGELYFFLPITQSRKQEVGDFKSCLDIALDIEIIVQISLSYAYLSALQKHLSQRSGMFEDEHSSAWATIRPGSAAPQPHPDIFA